MIKIENLKKEYANVTPLKNVSVEIHEGDVISVIGPSGTGKSTLLRCINRLEEPNGGHIWIDGEDIMDKRCDIQKIRQKMGMVFQSFNLFGHLTVIENIMISPMDLLGKSKQEAYDRGMELLQTVGLAAKALNYPDELSGGQKQRVAIARALAMDPEIILLDEPTSALDPTMVGEVQAVIRELSKSGKTMMIVTHEMNFAKAISNRVFYMDDGGIYEDGTPEQIFDHPQRERTRQFIRRLKIFEAEIRSRSYDFIAFGAELDRYLLQNDVPSAKQYRIRLCLEELIQQILLPKYEKPAIRAKVLYSMKDQECNITVTYGGEAFDFRDTDNEMSLTMLKNTAQELSYHYDSGAVEGNCAEIRIR